MQNKEKSMGCCNMLLWDILCVIIVAWGALPNSIHFIIRILIGIGAAIVLLFLFTIPVVGTILDFGFGLMWTYTIWEIFKVGKWEIVQEHSVLGIIIPLVLAFFCITIHITSTDGLTFPIRNKRFRSDDSEEERHSDYHYTYEEQFQEQKEEKQEDEPAPDFGNTGFDPFAGCSSAESVVKRYKNLSKNFHPDVVDCDTEQMQLLNELYQKKSKEFE